MFNNFGDKLGEKMDTVEIKRAYLEWIRENEKYTELSSNSIRIETPFLDNSLEHIVLYVTNDNSKIIINDNGHTLQALEAHGFTFNIGSYRYVVLHYILKVFNLYILDNGIYIECTKNDFSSSKQKIIQGIIRINDLIFQSNKKQ